MTPEEIEMLKGMKEGMATRIAGLEERIWTLQTALRVALEIMDAKGVTDVNGNYKMLWGKDWEELRLVLFERITSI